MPPGRDKKSKGADGSASRPIKNEPGGSSSSRKGIKPEHNSSPSLAAVPIKQENINPSSNKSEYDAPDVPPAFKADNQNEDGPMLNADEGDDDNENEPVTPKGPYPHNPPNNRPHPHAEATPACSVMWTDGENCCDEHYDGTLDGRKCKIHIRFNANKDREAVDWLEIIAVNCTINGKNVGHCLALYIKQFLISSDFHQEMHNFDSATSHLALGLFDRFGRLQRQYIDHVFRKGTGIWGSELDQGDILYIDHFCGIPKKLRGKGVEQVILKDLRQKLHSGPKDPDRNSQFWNLFTGLGLNNPPGTPASTPRDLRFELIDPTGWDGNLEPPESNKKAWTRFHEDNSRANVSLIRSLGFRRIGKSNFFAYASADETHPSRTLTAAQDFDPGEFPVALMSPIEHDPLLLPRHTAMRDMSDAEGLRYLRATGKPPQHPFWSTTNSWGQNVLHQAGWALNTQCIKWLMQNIDGIHNLSSTRDLRGNTPLDAHNAEGQMMRTFGPDIPDPSRQDCFISQHDNTIQVARALMGSPSLSQKELASLKYDCSCGDCLGGFLTPRMCVALRAHADLAYRTLSYGIDDGPIWILMHDRFLKHVPDDLKQKIRADKSIRKGWVDIFQIISSAISQSLPPTVDNVERLARASAPSKKLIKRGGKVGAVIALLLGWAKKSDPLAGTGKGMELYGEEYKKLKECRNDSEYGFVANNCQAHIACRCLSARPGPGMPA